MATRPPSADASQQGQQAENYKEYHVKRPGTTPRDDSGAPPRVRARESGVDYGASRLIRLSYQDVLKALVRDVRIIDGVE
jgi:hypothetical protein